MANILITFLNISPLIDLLLLGSLRERIVGLFDLIKVPLVDAIRFSLPPSAVVPGWCLTLLWRLHYWRRQVAQGRLSVLSSWQGCQRRLLLICALRIQFKFRFDRQWFSCCRRCWQIILLLLLFSRIFFLPKWFLRLFFLRLVLCNLLHKHLQRIWRSRLFLII